MGAAKKHALCCDCSKLFLNNPAVGTFKRHRAQDAGAIGASIQADATGEFDNFFKDRMAVNNSHEIGRASCRERVCQYVYISVVAVSLKKKKNNKTTQSE